MNFTAQGLYKKYCEAYAQNAGEAKDDQPSTWESLPESYQNVWAAFAMKLRDEFRAGSSLASRTGQS